MNISRYCCSIENSYLLRSDSDALTLGQDKFHEVVRRITESTAISCAFDMSKITGNHIKLDPKNYHLAFVPI